MGLQRGSRLSVRVVGCVLRAVIHPLCIDASGTILAAPFPLHEFSGPDKVT